MAAKKLEPHTEMWGINIGFLWLIQMPQNGSELFLWQIVEGKFPTVLNGSELLLEKLSTIQNESGRFRAERTAYLTIIQDGSELFVGLGLFGSN